MSTAARSNLGTSISNLARDQQRAESLLAELAMELRRVPVDEQTRTLHLRALSIKRAVMHWPEELPDESIRHAVVDEVIAMQGEARDRLRLCSLRRQSGQSAQSAEEGLADD